MSPNMIDIEETLALFVDLQTLGDKPLRKLAFSHVIHSIKRMNQKHKNAAKNCKLQNIVFAMPQQDEEAKTKRALTTVSFTGGSCGSMIEPQMPFLLHVFIRRQGS